MNDVLIIDDDPATIELMSTALSRKGYQVRTACNGVEGEREVKCSPPDLVITDIVMPEKEGIYILRVLRDLAPEIKVIAISGATCWGGEHLNYLDVAMRLGADRTFAKPFHLPDLLASVGELCAEKSGKS